jgi:hypothetical protein
MSTQPVDVLELRALEQRRQIHATATELKGKISAAKEKLDVVANLRHHLFAIAMGLGVVSLLVGTMIARRFSR